MLNSRELVYRALQSHQRSQLLIGAHDKTLSVAMRVNNPDRSPFNPYSCWSAVVATNWGAVVFVTRCGCQHRLDRPTSEYRSRFSAPRIAFASFCCTPSCVMVRVYRLFTTSKLIRLRKSERSHCGWHV